MILWKAMAVELVAFFIAGLAMIAGIACGLKLFSKIFNESIRRVA